MQGIGPALLFALSHLFHPRMLWLMLWPVLAAAIFWGALASVFWSEIAAWFGGVLEGLITRATFFWTWDASTVAEVSAKILIVVSLIPLIQLSALLIIGVVAMPAAVRLVVARRFESLERMHGGSVAGSVWNGLVSVLGMLVLFVGTLPLWIVPPLWPLIPVAILAWVNQRVLRYDALAEHASAGEMQALFRARRLGLYLLGVLLALLAFVPVVGLFAPALFTLAFAHYLLAELKAHRGG